MRALNADVVFYEAFKEEEAVLKNLLPRGIKAAFTAKTIQEEKEAVPSAALISIRTQSKVPLSWGRQLKGILARTTGYDHLLNLDPNFFNHVVLGSLEPYCSRAVAEQAVLSMFALLRGIKKQLTQFEQFNRDGLTGREVKGKTIAVIGVGRIGAEVVEMARGLKMKVIGVDIVQRRKDVDYLPLKSALKKADVIVVAAPLTEKTNKMLNYSVLRTVKRGGVLINISRGEITPLKDCRRLLDDGSLGGLALDVFEDESAVATDLRFGRKTNHKDLLQMGRMDNVLLTPHNAFNTQEALWNKSDLSVRAAVQFLKQGTFPTMHRLK